MLGRFLTPIILYPITYSYSPTVVLSLRYLPSFILRTYSLPALCRRMLATFVRMLSNTNHY